MTDPPTLALRWAQAAVSFWLIAFLGIEIDVRILYGSTPSELVWGSACAIALLGLWRRVMWGFQLSICLAWFATLSIWGFLIPVPDNDPAAMTGLMAMLCRMDTDVSRDLMIALVIATLTSTVLLIRQKDRFRLVFW